MPLSVHCRSMLPGEEPDAFALVMRGFDGFVRPDFTSEGVAEFTQKARVFLVADPSGHVVSVAELDGRLVGVIDVRDASHIRLFFVEPALMGRGIGRRLLDHALAQARALNPDLTRLTVNASPWAVPVYRALAFEETGKECEQGGIRYVPMERRLDEGSCRG